MDKEIFDSIRPYRDDEIPAAMQRIADNSLFPMLASYVFPDADIAAVKEELLSIRSITEFQARIMAPMNRQIIGQTMTEFTYGGIDQLSPDMKYLFIGNHRDIVLDSSLMQYTLFCNGHETSEITFGSNLMQNQLIVDIGKSNKMFKVERPGNNAREFYRSSQQLSEYIRQVICELHRSVWIAQRNGRTKDGFDLTDQGLIKMLGMSRKGDKVNAMDELHIVPVAISYEWEPCDILKVLELYEKQQMGYYLKKPGEDINSILTGMLQPKGKVHLEFCEPLKYDDFAVYDAYTLSDFNRAVAALIDRRIHRAYRFMSNNYIAHDLNYGQDLYAEKYTEEQKAAFLNRLGELKQYEEECNVDDLSELLVGIYTHPLDFADR
ncbi:MAG: acyltransferase [Paraprevotella sp.]|nr:acyltransferase [Paraprevotella sp.]